MKQLAICMPTYNQPEMIREMCIRCLDIYRENDVELYIYDSSPDSETERIVSECRVKYDNLFYTRLSPDTHSNIKVLDAYKERIGTGEHTYLWLCPDYIQLTSEGIKCVLRHCEEGFDVCVLNYRDVEHIGERSYEDMNVFFRECAWHMSSYMATVIRISSFADIDWEEFCRRYTVPERINHSHVAFYFEQLARLPKARAVHVPVSSVHMRVSAYRKESMWKKEMFSVWAEYWPEMIRALPEYYRFKEETVRKLGINTGIFGWDNFVELRREKIYDKEVYERYRNEWKNLTNISPVFLRLLAGLPAEMAVLLKRPNLKRGFMNVRLRRFCDRNRNIVIYGCGFIAERTSSVLDELHIRYQGYIVSDGSNEKTTFHGLPVMECREFFQKNPDVGVIIALNKENATQVIKEQQGLRFYKMFYMYKYEEVLE